MRTPQHSWKVAATQHGRRFGIGLSLALAFVLLAFEWRSATIPRERTAPELVFTDDALELPPIVILKKEPSAPAASTVRKKQPSSIIVPGPEPVPDPGPQPDPGPKGDPVPDPGPPDPGPLNKEEVIDDGPMPWGGVEQRPYFRRCLDARREHIDECTERIIDQHLKRHFVVPENMRREERTTVSIVIDKDGGIANVICAPKPSPAVQAEIERVIRDLPPMNPATQNGRPVPVVFQLPFRVSRI